MISGDCLIEFELTAVNSSCLDDTDADSPKGPGVLYLWVCSTVNTATLETTQVGHDAGKLILIRKRTDGIPSLEDDPPITIPLVAGTKPVVVLGGTTGTCHFTGIIKYKR